MDIERKIEINKMIRSYSGTNSFILSLQSHLKNSKYLEKIVVGKRSMKFLSDKQYETALNVLTD